LLADDPEQLRASSTSTTMTAMMPMARPASRRYSRSGSETAPPPPLPPPSPGSFGILGICGVRRPPPRAGRLRWGGRGWRGGAPCSGGGAPPRVRSSPSPEGRVMAVSWVLLGSSQSSSKKSSGGTRGPYHPPRMRNWRNPGSSGQSVPVAQPAPATDPASLEGRVVAGRYRLTDVLGKGGFGSVYTGRDAASGESVAVKVFSREEGLAPRADREARTAQKLDHPNIHEVVGVAHDDDHAYLISQLVVGERFDRSELSD